MFTASEITCLDFTKIDIKIKREKRQKNNRKRCYNGRNCYDFLNPNDVNRFVFCFDEMVLLLLLLFRFIYIYRYLETKKVDIYLLPEEFVYTQQLNCADSSTIQNLCSFLFCAILVKRTISICFSAWFECV